MIWKAKTNKQKNPALFKVSGEILLIPKEGTQESKSLSSTERYHSRYDYRNCWHHPIINRKMKPTHGVQNQGDHKEKETEP